MTTPEQLDQLITNRHEGKSIMPQSPEEQLTLDLIDLVESIPFNADLDAQLAEKFQDAPKPAKNRPITQFPALRVLAMSAAASLLLILSIIAIPSLRAFAQEVLGQIGNILITDAPTQQELMRDGLYTPQPLEAIEISESVEQATGELTYAEVERLVDFPIYTPNYIPEGYQHLHHRTWEPNYTSTSSLYTDKPDDLYNANYINIVQRHLTSDEPDELAVGEAEVKDTKVNGRDALFIDQTLVGSRYENGELDDFTNWSFVIWEQDGFQFSVSSTALSEEEMIRIAESMVNPNLAETYTYEEITALVDYPIYTAGYIPETLEFMDYKINFSDDFPQQVYATYRGELDSRAPIDMLFILQRPIGDEAPVEFPIGDAEVNEVTVNGINAIFVDEALYGTQTYPNRDYRTFFPMSYLLWEQDGFMFIIQTNVNDLPQDELIRIAESMTP